MTDLFAEDVSYWKTSATSPDKWIEKAIKQIESAGGQVLRHAFGSDGGHEAYMIDFVLVDDAFKILWQVLPTRTKNNLAARRQAATALYHDVKARALSAKWIGSRGAFFSYIMLADGRPAAMASAPELMSAMPRLLQGG